MAAAAAETELGFDGRPALIGISGDGAGAELSEG